MEKYEGKERRVKRDISTWEKHGQTILASLILACILWVVHETNEQSKNAIRVNGKIEALDARITGLSTIIEQASRDRFTSSDAEKEGKLRDQQHEAIYQRFHRNEKRIEKLEAK